MATVTWIGAANDVAQIDTITVADTWAAADTVTVTINNQDLVLTAGSTMDSTAEIAAGIAEMINSSFHQDDLMVADMTITKGVQ